MAAATVNGTLYGRSSYPLRDPAGTTWVAVEETIATTSLDDAGDIVRLVKLPHGVEIVGIAEQHAALDSGTAIDMDIILVDDDNVVATPKVLYNAGTAFEAVTTTFLWVDPTAYFGYRVVSQGDDVAYIGLKVNTAATTAVAGAVRLLIAYRGAGAGGV